LMVRSFSIRTLTIRTREYEERQLLQGRVGTNVVKSAA
jgi:hypothetical protein